jgi:hypothetical protein
MASANPERSSSFITVVDSPPGMTIPSTCASSQGVLMADALAPLCSSALRCSLTSPCKPRTPTLGRREIGLIPSRRQQLRV